MELQIWKGDGTWKVVMSHMPTSFRRGSIFDRNSLSNHLSNMGQDQDLYTRMKGLEESMKLILVNLNIAGVENTGTEKKNIEIHAASSSARNPKKDNPPHLNLKMRAWRRN